MTSEVLLMNQEAVVLAADSAVSNPIFHVNDVDKFFVVSQDPPIAAMFYNAVQFGGVGWSILFGRFARMIEGRNLTVDEVADGFLAFLEQVGDDPYFAVDKAAELEAFNEYVALFLAQLVSILQRIGWVPGRLPVDVIIMEALSLLEDDILSGRRAGGRDEDPLSEEDTPAPEFFDFLEQNFEQALRSGIAYVCYEFEIDPRALDLPGSAIFEITRLMVISCMVDWVPAGYASLSAGLVFAGFHPGSPFPVAREFRVFPSFGGLTKVTDRRRHAISSEFDSTAVIRTFAQTETLDSFLHKVSFRNRRRIANELKYYVSLMRRSASARSARMSAAAAAEIDTIFAGMIRNMSDVIDSALPRKSLNLRNTLSSIRNASPQRLSELARKSMQMIVHGEELASNDTVGRPVKFLVLSRDGIRSDLWE